MFEVFVKDENTKLWRLKDEIKKTGSHFPHIKNSIFMTF